MQNNVSFFQRIGILLLLVFNLAYAINLQTVSPIPKVEPNTLVIQKVDLIDHGDKLSWYAKVKNIGNTIAKNKLEISAF